MVLGSKNSLFSNLKIHLNLNSMYKNLCIWVLGKAGHKIKGTLCERAEALHSCGVDLKSGQSSFRDMAGFVSSIWN